MATLLSTWTFSERAGIFLVVLGVGVCLFPAEGQLFLWWESHAIELMWGLLLVGFLFFLTNRSRLMLIAFSGCAVLCYVLNQRMDATLKPAAGANDAFSLRIGTFQFNGEEEPTDSILLEVLSTDIDVLSLEGVAPRQIEHIASMLKERGYPHSRFEPYRDQSLELAVFSRFPMEFYASIRHSSTPSVLGRLLLPLPDSLRQLTFLCTVLPDPRRENRAARRELTTLSQQLAHINMPILAMGNFQQVAWSSPLQSFKGKSALRDSRRGLCLTSREGFFTLFEQPKDYIFYSNHFQCVSFETISGRSGAHMGIIGTYQLTKGRAHVQQTSQEL